MPPIDHDEIRRQILAASSSPTETFENQEREKAVAALKAKHAKEARELAAEANRLVKYGELKKQAKTSERENQMQQVWELAESAIEQAEYLEEIPPIIDAVSVQFPELVPDVVESLREWSDEEADQYEQQYVAKEKLRELSEEADADRDLEDEIEEQREEQIDRFQEWIMQNAPRTNADSISDILSSYIENGIDVDQAMLADPTGFAKTLVNSSRELERSVGHRDFKQAFVDEFATSPEGFSLFDSDPELTRNAEGFRIPQVEPEVSAAAVLRESPLERAARIKREIVEPDPGEQLVRDLVEGSEAVREAGRQRYAAAGREEAPAEADAQDESA